MLLNIVWAPDVHTSLSGRFCDCILITVIMGPMASQIAVVWIVYSTVCSGADQRKRQSSASLAFVRGIYRGPVDTPHKGPVTRKYFHFMSSRLFNVSIQYRILCKIYHKLNVLSSYNSHRGIIMILWHANLLCITGLLEGESVGHQRILSIEDR